MKRSSLSNSPLEDYGNNLTDVVRHRSFPLVKGDQAAVTRVFEILLRQATTNNHANPLLLSQDAMSRWRVVIEVARRIVTNNVPASFPIQQIVVLNYEALLATVPIPSSPSSAVRRRQALPTDSEAEAALASGSNEMLEQLLLRYFPNGLWPPLEEWEAHNALLARLHSLLLAVRQTQGQVLLFVDHFHWLLGGAPQGSTLDAATLLKPTLARRELQLIAACTPEEYRQFIERDAAIARRVQEIYLDSE